MKITNEVYPGADDEVMVRDLKLLDGGVEMRVLHGVRESIYMIVDEEELTANDGQTIVSFSRGMLDTFFVILKGSTTDCGAALEMATRFLEKNGIEITEEPDEEYIDDYVYTEAGYIRSDMFNVQSGKSIIL